MIAKMEETKEELLRHTAQLKKHVKAAKEEAAGSSSKRDAAKPPWAFSPSGKWRPGLWMGPNDRSEAVSMQKGEPAHSVSFIERHQLGVSLLSA